MKKVEFLKKLSYLIDALPKTEKERILTFYNETLEDHIEEGMKEEDAVASLEDVQIIAEKILSENHILQRGNTASPLLKKSTNNVLLLVGSPLWVPLLFTFYFLLFTGYLLVWVLISTMYIGVASFALGAITCVISMVFLFTSHWLTAILALGMGLFFAGLTIFTFYGTCAVSNGLLQWTKNIWLTIKNKCNKKK